MNAPTCYACGEEMSRDERYSLVLLGNKNQPVPVCSERDRAHEILRAS